MSRFFSGSRNSGGGGAKTPTGPMSSMERAQQMMKKPRTMNQLRNKDKYGQVNQEDKYKKALEERQMREVAKNYSFQLPGTENSAKRGMSESAKKVLSDLAAKKAKAEMKKQERAAQRAQDKINAQKRDQQRLTQLKILGLVPQTARDLPANHMQLTMSGPPKPAANPWGNPFDPNNKSGW